MAPNLLSTITMKNIAIVDDDASSRFVIRGFVEEAGLKVVAEGENGAEAVEICRTKRPDVVLMDINMPGKDGIEAAAEIGRECPTPVILLTARDDEATVKRAASAGVMAYLVKPVREEELLPAIELAVSRFKEFRLLREENTELKSALAARKTIEKAKGLLMARESVSEGEAFGRIRKIAMDKRKSMAEIAQGIRRAFEKG